MEIQVQEKKAVEAKELQLYLKVADRFTAALVDSKGKEICSQGDDYVPGFMPGEHYGDYVILNIDIETGQVTNWVKPCAEDLEEWVNKCRANASDE